MSFGGNPAGEGFLGAAPGGAYQAGCGTSYATPAAARGLATLLASCLPSITAARTCCARSPLTTLTPGTRDLHAVGYGRLAEDYRPPLQCPDGTVTVLISDTLTRGPHRHIRCPTRRLASPAMCGCAGPSPS